MENIFDIQRLRKDLITNRVIDKNISLRDLASSTGISAATLSRIENAKMPDVETFAKLCVYLQVDPRIYFNIIKPRHEGFLK